MIQPGPQVIHDQTKGVDHDQRLIDLFGLREEAPAGPTGPGLNLFQSRLTQQTKLISFDVFDTVLTRRVGNPEAIFLLVGQRLKEAGLIQSSAEAFAHTRYISEKRARGNKPGREITLREVYEEIVCFFKIETNLDRMVEVELAVEREAIVVITSMTKAVEEARARYGKVVFISDMYLSKVFMEDRLQALGLMKPGDRLYLSSNEGVQKADGQLFKIVLKQEGIKPKELLHIGNSSAHDVAPAKRLGIGHYHFEEGDPHPSEAVLNRASIHSEGETALLAGSARLARLEGIGLTGHEKAIWQTGASVTGPLVWMYAQWVVSRAEQKNTRQLYFLARDAYPVYLAVQAILEDRPELQMQARYIYGSRPTYYAMGIKHLGEKEWDRLTSYGVHRYHTLEALCNALMAKPETLKQHLDGLGLSGVGWDVELTNDQLDAIRQHALEDQAFNHALMNDLSDYQALQRRYFEQQGFNSAEGVALVDSGWTTRSHAPLYHFLASMGCDNVRLFYIGLLIQEPYIPMDAIDTFMFNRATKQGVLSHKMVYTRALETLFTSFHGRTSRFIDVDGRVKPVLASLEDEAFVSRYMETYFQGFRAFIRHMRSAYNAFDGIHNTRDVSERVLYRFWRKPTSGEAEAWSQLTWEWDPLGQVRHSLARPYRLRDAAAAFIQNRSPALYPQFWTGAAKRLTPRYILVWLRFAISARRSLEDLLSLVPASVRDPITKFRRALVSFKHHHR